MERSAPTATAARPATAKPAGGRRPGPRPKHVPRRMCVACRGHDAKRGLHRIVRTPEGTVELDPTGKRNGRGAYLCVAAACWERALGSNALARALKTEIGTETAAALRAFAATLPPAEPAARARSGEMTKE